MALQIRITEEPIRRENKDLINFHKEMIFLRKTCLELKFGSFMNLGEDYGYIAYGRFMKDSQSAIMVNNSEREIEKEINMGLLGTPTNATVCRKMFTFFDGYTTKKEYYMLNDGKIVVKLPRHSAMVLRYAR